MNENEVLELLKRAKRQNDMVAILPDSDTSKVLIKVLEESTWILVDGETCVSAPVPKDHGHQYNQERWICA